MIVARTPDDLSRILSPAKRCRSIGFVPTMGALHEGHGALVAASRRKCAVTVVSIFVNPLQFESASAYRRYPRSRSRDLKLLSRWRADVAYCPSARIFSTETDLSVTESRVSRLYEGELRPGHFKGVLTIVAKLFIHVRPTHAFFGEKDFQQLWLVRKMADELSMGIDIVSIPTVRDGMGIACSSRNARLSCMGRTRASAIYGTLREIQTKFSTCRRAAILTAEIRRRLASQGIRVEYAAVVSPRDFSAPPFLTRGRPYRMLVSANIDGVHLIDNILLRAS